MNPTSLTPGENGLPVRALLQRLGEKWSLVLLGTLSKTPGPRARFSELEHAVPGVSQRMMTVTLRHLERDGLIRREVFSEVPPRVEYALTTLGQSLLDPLQSLLDWVGTHCGEVQRARAQYDTPQETRGYRAAIQVHPLICGESLANAVNLMQEGLSDR